MDLDRAERLDFGEGLLPEDSWMRELEENEYEVEEIMEDRTSKKTRYGRKIREFKVRWKVHPDLSWVDELDMNCGASLQDYERRKVNPNGFDVMQSNEE